MPRKPSTTRSSRGDEALISLPEQIAVVDDVANVARRSHFANKQWDTKDEKRYWLSLVAAANSLRLFRHHLTQNSDRFCVYCGCSDFSACEGGCAWLVQFPTGNTGICTNVKCIDRFGADSFHAAGKALGLAQAMHAQTHATPLHALSGRRSKGNK